MYQIAQSVGSILILLVKPALMAVSLAHLLIFAMSAQLTFISFKIHALKDVPLPPFP